MKEAERIRKIYRNRDLNGRRGLYSHYNIASLLHYQQRERKLLALLQDFRIDDLSNQRILDVGCGDGSMLREFLKYGAIPQNCFGIDLLKGRIETAKTLSPNMSFFCGTADEMPYDDSYFDLVLCFTVFTSILDWKIKKRLAGEMLRVLRSGGSILWYDFHIDNPRNKNVQGVKKKEIEQLFSECEVSLKKSTLAPPIARAVAPHSFILCLIMEKVPLLRTHYLGAIKKLL